MGSSSLPETRTKKERQTALEKTGDEFLARTGVTMSEEGRIRRVGNAAEARELLMMERRHSVATRARDFTRGRVAYHSTDKATFTDALDAHTRH